MERIKKEKAFWDDMAHEFDTHVKRYDPKLTASKIAAVVMSPYEGQSIPKTVVELGSGTGKILINLAKKYDHSEFIGLDISDKMVALASDKSENLNNITYGVIDGRKLNHIPYKLVDFVYSVNVFQHIPDDAVENYIKQIGKVLRKGGLLRFQFVQGDEKTAFSQNHSLEDIRKWCSEAKLEIISVKEGLIYDVWTWITAKKK